MISNDVEKKSQKLGRSPKYEDVVISGMAGKFPESDNIYQFRDNLFNKMNLITEGNHRWKSTKVDLPQKEGRLRNVFAFDAGFFGIHKRLANHMDFYQKLLLESVYEVIMDAGYHPSELAATNTGVFIAATTSEAENCILYGTQVADSHSMIGAARSLIAQQISYFFHLQGASYTIDSGCSSSIYAIEQAYRSIKEGVCDMAIVGGANLILLPHKTQEIVKLRINSKDGRCKSFDKNADGYVRAEAISTLLFQKSKDARRIYAHCIHAKLNCDGYKDQDMTHPSSYMQTLLMKEIYNDCNINLSNVSFLEAHGTGTKVGDFEELTAISEVFCSQRKTPLYIGSVKSNAGHSEPVAALVSVVKVLIGMECGFIPPNINYFEPREDVDALAKGQLKVITEAIPWPDDKGITGIHNLGIGGTNGHVILRWNDKVAMPEDDLPRLVCASGRTKDAINVIWKDLSSRCLDVEFVSLLHAIFKKGTSNHPFRGYQILSKVGGELKRSWNEVNGNKRKLAWVFNNFDPTWSKIGKQLIAFPVFMEALETVRSKAMYPLNLDVVQLLATYRHETKVNQMLATMTVQICLATVLKSIGVTPDTIIGLGTGEFIASYFEGHITLNDLVRGLPLSEDVNCIISTSNLITKKLLLSDFETLVIGGEIEGFEHLSLIRENSRDCVFDLLDILGRLYENGHDLNLCNLYPQITWPVSRGTPMISPLLRWNHDLNCDVAFHDPKRKGQRIIDIDLKNDDWELFNGHVIDGKNIFPSAACIFFVWETLAVMKGKPISKTKVVFEDVNFVQVIDLTNQNNIQLVIYILEGSNTFEIIHGEAKIMMGKVYELLDAHQDLPEPAIEEIDEIIILTQAEIYRELRLRGYGYKNQFKSIETTVGKKKGFVKWTGNWTTFLDGLLQILILHMNTRNLYLPFSINQLIIDPAKLIEIIDEAKEETLIPIDVCDDLGIIRTKGIELRGLKGLPISREEDKSPILECNKFVPYITTLSLIESIRILIQIITENNSVTRFKVGELPGESQLISPLITQLVDSLPQIQAEVTVFSSKISLNHPGITFKDSNLKEKENLLLVILTRAFKNREVLQDVLKAVKRTNGYILTREQLNFNVPLTHQDLDVLCVHSTESEKLVLLRLQRDHEELMVIRVINVSNDLLWLTEAQDLIKRAQPLALYSQNQFTSGILGLVNCLRKEPNGDCVTCFFIMDDAPAFDPNHPFYEKQFRKHMAINVWKGGKWGTYRHLLLEENVVVPCSSCYVDVTVPGDLTSLKFIEGNKHELDGVHVYWSSLNFRDVLAATGRILLDVPGKDFDAQKHVLGIEFSGRDSAGKRVMGLSIKGSLATQTVAEPSMIWEVPDEWSLEDAATVPGAYLTVIYALLMKAKIKCGQYILIHFGDGSVGQAAINIALRFGCALFVTVDTQDQMSFLRENYPQIEEGRIAYSGNASFEETVLLETKGRGLDVVLNPMTEKELPISVRCMARQGNWFEIGKCDTKLKMGLLPYGINFHYIILDSLITNSAISVQLSRQFTDLLCQRAIKPTSRTVFGMEEVADAIELMTTGKQIGKILVNIRKEDEYFIGTFKTALPRFHCDPKGTYVIVGGLGGFGIQLANWLVSRGARKLVLNSRTGLKNGYQAMMLRLWRSYNAQISISTDDATIKEGCTDLITRANSLGPVKAIFNLALALKDALFEDQTVESFKVSLAPKAIVTMNLDVISRVMCPELRYFVVFSSGSCGRGNSMQSSYGFANSVMERICEERKADGFPALAIQWGPFDDVGVIEDFRERAYNEIIIGGTSPQRVSSCLQVLDKLLAQDETIVGSIIIAEKDTYSNSNVLNAVLNILGIRDLAIVSPHLSLVEFGMNSVMNAQIKQVLETDFEVFLSSKEINAMTLANLQDMATNLE